MSAIRVWNPFTQQLIQVLTEAFGSRVIFGESSDASTGNLTAIGVEFLHHGTKYVVNCNKEVVLSAGYALKFLFLEICNSWSTSTVKNPQILELSGIGRREVLEKIGVETNVELPGVGENVQEHVVALMSYELKSEAGHEEALAESEKA